MLDFAHRRLRLCLAILMAICPLTARAQRLIVRSDHPDGVYRIGETVKWSVKWEGADAPGAADFVVKKGGLTEIARGSVMLAGGSGEVTQGLDKPEAVSVEVRAKTADGKSVRGLGGAVVEPGRIELGAARPKDFDRFWAAKVKELQAVPMSPRLEPVDSGKPGVDYWKVTLDNIRGTHIQGQLARPSGTGKLPALLIVQWAGVYGLQKPWVADRAAEGWLCLNIEAHDLPIDQPASFYQEQFAGPLRNYWEIGNDDREKSYFLRMYLSCYRAADYLAHRPDWDGKTLVVMGGSQGGMQALMTAGFYPKITAALADVPAGCDLTGPDHGRQSGWPLWYWNVSGKDSAKVREASRYFDVAHFASHIKCPVLVGVGLIDETCSPEGIVATVNQIKSPSELVIMPISGHQNENGSQARYDERCWTAWMPALRQGKPAPVAERESSTTAQR